MDPRLGGTCISARIQMRRQQEFLVEEAGGPSVVASMCTCLLSASAAPMGACLLPAPG